jgi:predicted small integral membrane protein
MNSSTEESVEFFAKISILVAGIAVWARRDFAENLGQGQLFSIITAIVKEVISSLTYLDLRLG